MNKLVSDLKALSEVDPLALLRQPFPEHQVSKLPKETKAQAEQRKADRNTAINCKVCGGWHHKNAVHLDYVGHAALTDRLLDTDPHWSWEPVAFRDGLPAFDQTGGLWIKLTVCDVTRLGYGHAAAKPQMDPGSREKEVIGDALRNAAMRFGAALDLWHKGDLHVEAAEEPAAAPERKQVEPPKPPSLAERADRMEATLKAVKTADELKKAYGLGGKLFDDLERSDPERRVELAMLYETRLDQLTEEAAQ